MTSSSNAPPAAGWDTYWQGAKGGPAYGGESERAAHPVLLSFWSDFFAAVRDEVENPRIVDVASGSGAVIDCAVSVLGSGACEFTCVDVSAPAVQALTERHPDVTGVVADACAIPLASESFDVVTSQFGIEYAGPEAVGEIARLLAEGGRLALLMHQHGGAIHRQCMESIEAIGAMQAAEFIARTMAVFNAGFAACRGESRDAYEAAVQDLRPAVSTMESIIGKHGKQVADGTIARFYGDVARIHERLPSYVPGEVLNWLSGMQQEFEAYLQRMTAMCDAAIDAPQFGDLQRQLQEAGIAIDRAESLQDAPPDVPLGWVLTGSKTPKK